MVENTGQKPRRTRAELATLADIEPDKFKRIHKRCGLLPETKVGTKFGETVMAVDEMAELPLIEVRAVIALECPNHGVTSAPVGTKHDQWKETSEPLPKRIRTVSLIGD